MGCGAALVGGEKEKSFTFREIVSFCSGKLTASKVGDTLASCRNRAKVQSLCGDSLVGGEKKFHRKDVFLLREINNRKDMYSSVFLCASGWYFFKTLGG